MPQLELTGGMSTLAGGLMMGSAIILLYFMLRGPKRTGGRDDSGGSRRWAVLLGFVLGALLGAYAISQFVNTHGYGRTENVLLGLIVGACLTYFLARRPMRQ